MVDNRVFTIYLFPDCEQEKVLLVSFGHWGWGRVRIQKSVVAEMNIEKRRKNIINGDRCAILSAFFDRSDLPIASDVFREFAEQ